MPRYYCDYCGTYLTHDSAPGRRQHNRGWKHTDNVKLHYKQFLDDFVKKQAANGGAGPSLGTGAMPTLPMNMCPEAGSGPRGPMGSGSLGMGAMNNSLMSGGMGGHGPMGGGGPMMGAPPRPGGFMGGGPMSGGPMMGGPHPGGFMGPGPMGPMMGGPRPGGFVAGGPPRGPPQPQNPPLNGNGPGVPRS